MDWVRLGADMEDLATKTLKGTKRVSGFLRPMTIVPYRGFVTDGVAHVRARVREEPRVESAAEGLRLDATLVANLLRWVVLDMPGVEVEVAIGDASVTATSNEDGFVIAKVPVGDIGPGWHAVRFTAVGDDGREVRAQGRVVLPDPASKIAVVTDIDDTILRTGMTEGLKSVQRTLLRDAHGRKPVPGMPSLYRGIARGPVPRPESTVFYVSATPWNLYDMLVQFLQLRGFPRGPLFLTDWRPGPVKEEQEPELKYAGHKNARIRRLLDAYPELSFVLIGDSGEHDADIYASFIESDPDRISAVLIRDVGADSLLPPLLRPRESDQTSGEIDPAKPQLCADSLQMAEVALRLGLVDELTLEEVATELGARL